MEATGVVPARAKGAAEWMLRFAVALQCVGAAWWFEHGSSALESFALIDLGWDVDAAGWLDRIQSIALLAGAVVALARPRRVPLLAVALLFATEAVFHGLGDERLSHVAPYAAGMRVAAPFALALLAPSRPQTNDAPLWVLKVGIAAAFVAHGVEAWLRNPAFIDLVLAFDMRLGGFGFGLHESDARAILVAIAVHDWILPVALLATRWRWVPVWMGIWGGAAALARVVQGGLDLWPEAVVRASHGLAPFAVAALLCAHAGARRRC
ncbi:hypothetical protein Pla163_08970 [Planctomycetes bacterium Pla163]|uniref:Uncharacterized protein n=2 Tax=Rohdeia mirabilis TaxID=2528008 RepID=A0A518CX61_9BACT|nr:hypothetical protein Pla163_08970 [Planctomycetes bacterium Pla163]